MEMSDKEKLKYEALGYSNPKYLENNEVAGLIPFIFTTGLVVGIDDGGNYKYRFCYPKSEDALKALKAWDGNGDPPGNWLKRKGLGGEKSNPLTFKEIPIVEEKIIKNKIKM